MKQIDANQLLLQMRTLAAQAGGLDVRKGEQIGGGNDFATTLNSMINQVNETQQHAAAMSKSFEAGSSDADLAQVMIAMQKANLSFQAMTQVRNKLVAAYQDVMNMPV